MQLIQLQRNIYAMYTYASPNIKEYICVIFSWDDFRAILRAYKYKSLGEIRSNTEKEQVMHAKNYSDTLWSFRQRWLDVLHN